MYVATERRGAPRRCRPFRLREAVRRPREAMRDEAVTALVSYGTPRSPMVRIVDPETASRIRRACRRDLGARRNVAMGYWRNPQKRSEPSGQQWLIRRRARPKGPWLRTGDLGVMSDGELFIVGRMKDLLIVDGRNHYPDDIEATIQEISGGRVAAIAVPDDDTEKLVVIVELKKRRQHDEEAMETLRNFKGEVTSAISNSHGLSVADLVLVPPGSIPITTSGKVRRATCVELYRDGKFQRLDV